jgi:hypothetical protein
MKKITLLGAVAFLLLGTTSYAQNWRTGGNAPCPGPQCVDNTNNILGTMGNVPINIVTNGVNRMHINQDRSQTISGYTFNANGFIGIGQNSVAPTHPNGVWNDFGPFSILHINGFGGSEVKPSGFRPWMQAGISFTAFNDFSYL